MTSLAATIQQAETKWPQLHFRQKTAIEASSACPFCPDGGEDRFLIFADGGRYYCRQCKAKGFLDEQENGWSKLNPTEQRLRLLEAEQRRAKREREEVQRRLSALERMHNCKDHLAYHHGMTIEQMEYWLDEGMTVDTIAAYQLGWCSRCPTDREGRASYTIPVFDRDGTTLVNIRHRLIGGGDGGKYRPHTTGLPVSLFNSRFTLGNYNSLLVLEGEKKSAILDQEGFPNVGIMGKRSFKREWLEWLEPFKPIYVALDPDAAESARRLAGMFDGRGRVVGLPTKADDFFVRYKGTADDFRWFVSRARPIKAN